MFDCIAEVFPIMFNRIASVPSNEGVDVIGVVTQTFEQYFHAMWKYHKRMSRAYAEHESMRDDCHHALRKMGVVSSRALSDKVVVKKFRFADAE